MTTIYDFSVTTIDGQQQSLLDYQGKVLLIVNTASYCGFTPQYAGLQTLYERFGTEHFAVLAFPCNQFGHQEPNTNTEIMEFCDRNFHVTFPVFAKIEVNGEHADPLFRYLTKQYKGFLGTEKIKWNFTKFLISTNGQVVKRYGSLVPPPCLSLAIKQQLKRK